MSRHISLVLILSFCAVVHLDQLRIAEVGDSVHLPCLSSKDAKTTSVWMKQNPGEKPAVIATSYQQQPGTLKNGFEKSGRFKTHKSAESFNLTITDLEPSDTAIYYCAVIFFTDITFAEGTALVVKGAPLTSYKVHQEPVLEAVRPGGSVTLQCTVLTERCSEGHSVYWFRHGSGESHPGIIYSDGNRSDQCKSSSETDSSTQRCVYKLPKRNLSLSDAGTYYCAVAACGQILFGKGTKLQVDDNPSTVSTCTLTVIYSNISWLMISFLLVVLWCKKKSYSTGSTTCETCLDSQGACTEDLNFATLGTNKSRSSRLNRRQQKLKDTEVCSQVIYHQQN